MYTIVTRTTYPSWGYSISKGATTVWESFEDNAHSLNMKMFGSTEKFFYKDLGGIAPGSPGFRRIAIKPCIVGDLTWVKASHNTIRGRINVHWKKDGNSLAMEVTIPANTTAKVSVPTLGLKKVAIVESGKAVWKDGSYVSGVAGITGGSRSEGYVTLDAGSGRYSFRIK